MTTKPYVLVPPIPDGEISQGDRQHLAGIFSGELATDPDLTSIRISTLRTVFPFPYQFHVFE
jgi:hypothetical protein